MPDIPEQIKEAVEQTSIHDLFFKKPSERTTEDLTRIVAELRANRKNFKALDEAKAAGTVSKQARKLPSAPKDPAAKAAQKEAAKKITLDDLDIGL